MEIKKIISKCEKSTLNSWCNGEVNASNNPWLVYIATTNICNNRCVVCPQERTMRKDKGVMDLDVFNKIVDELPDDVKKVYLMKQGEPFINKNLEEFVIILRKKRPDLFISVHTNGILATKERVEKILPYIDSIGISISATSDELYQKVHKTNSFDKVLNNLQGMSDLLLNNNYQNKPHVFIDYVFQEGNKEEKEEEVVTFFKSKFPGLSSIDFHWVFNFQGEIEEGNMEIYKKLDQKYFPCCVFPYSAITFCYDGNVSYCFVEPRENRFLGNIMNESFEEIWNGKEYQKFRERVKNKQYDELLDDGFYCKNCSWLWSMKSQSPRNLSSGYSLADIYNISELTFGDLLDMDKEEVFKIGTDYYLSGEIEKAIGCFNFLKNSDNDIYVTEIDEMILLCNNVLEKYKHRYLYREMMKDEGINLDNKKCKYYKIR